MYLAQPSPNKEKGKRKKGRRKEKIGPDQAHTFDPTNP
jgi:hypothetical protein